MLIIYFIISYLSSSPIKITLLSGVLIILYIFNKKLTIESFEFKFIDQKSNTWLFAMKKFK
jgi:hypothetical protein